MYLFADLMKCAFEIVLLETSQDATARRVHAYNFYPSYFHHKNTRCLFA